MTYPKAIVISAALIATAIAFAAYQSTATAVEHPLPPLAASEGRYMVSSGDYGSAWAINTVTGEMRFCVWYDSDGPNRSCRAIQEGWQTP